ncbi:myb-like DNA-binding protein bas1 [Rhizina undulata]
MTSFDPQAERPWTAEEDKQLRNAVLREKSRPVKWDLVASSLPRRSKKECRKRWHYIMMEAVRKGEWKPEEDERLNSAIQKHGNNWCSVAQVVMTRDDIECKRRWTELQTRTTEENLPSNHSSPWFPLQEPKTSFPEHMKGNQEYPEAHGGFYGSAELLPNGFLQDYMISPHDANFPGMIVNNGQLPMAASTTLCPSPVGVIDNMDTYIDFEPEFSSPNTAEIYTPNTIHNQPFDANDWPWFENVVPGPSSISSCSELPESPGDYGSCASSYTSHGSIPHKRLSPDPEDAEIYQVQSSYGNNTPGDEMKASEPFGAKIVIVVNSNDAKTLSSLNSIMETLRANGHSIFQNPKKPEPDYKCTTLALNDVLQRY